MTPKPRRSAYPAYKQRRIDRERAVFLRMVQDVRHEAVERAIEQTLAMLQAASEAAPGHASGPLVWPPLSTAH